MRVIEHRMKVSFGVDENPDEWLALQQSHGWTLVDSETLHDPMGEPVNHIYTLYREEDDE